MTERKHFSYLSSALMSLVPEGVLGIGKLNLKETVWTLIEKSACKSEPKSG